jgi:hypothetical protein
MKTYTPEQFKQKYGEVGVAKFEQPKAKEPGYFSRVGSQIKSQFNEAVQSETEAMQGNKNPIYAGANIAKNVTGILTAPISQAPGIRQIGEGFQKAGETIVNTKPGQAFTTFLSKQASPETLGAVSDVLETGLNVGTLEGSIRGGKNLYNKTTGIIDKTKSYLNEPVEPGGTPPVDKNIVLNKAIEDATPSYETSSKAGKGKLLDRTQEGGILKGRTVKPNELEIEAGTELSKVPGYDPNSTKLAKYQVAKQEVANRAKALEQSLKQEKIAVPKREVTSRVQKVVNELPNKSLLLQSSDPVIKNYMRVFKNAFSNVSGTLDGVLELRKILDKAYENARGKQSFGSDKISALDDIHKATRDVLTQYLIEKAKNTNVKASLRSQWNLYRALDILQTAAENESGSVVGRMIQNNPITSKVVEMGVKAAGYGAGLGIVK